MSSSTSEGVVTPLPDVEAGEPCDGGDGWLVVGAEGLLGYFLFREARPDALVVAVELWLPLGPFPSAADEDWCCRWDAEFEDEEEDG